MNARRNRHGLLAVLGLTLAAVTALSACSSGSTAGTSSQGASGAKKTVTFGGEGDWAPSGYDPLLYSQGQRLFYSALYDSLFVVAEDGSIKPSLATAFSYNADKTQMTLTLKDGVTFSDGSQLTADLVKKNLDRRQDKTLVSYSAFATAGAAEITDVTAKDPKTVVLTFKAPQAAFEGQLADVPGMIVGEKAVADPATLKTAPDGSGPYTLDTGKTVRGSSYVLTKNPKSATAASAVWDGITFKPLTDPQARANALISGQVDIAQLAPQTADFVGQRGVGVVKNGGTVVEIAVFDKTGKAVKAFGDVRVRQAVSYAINRQALVDSLHKGQKATANAFPGDSPGFDAALDSKYAYDPAKAKALLAAAGNSSGITIKVVAGQDNIADWQVIQKDLAAVGITLQPKLASSTAEAFQAVNTTAMGLLPLAWDNPVGITAGVIVGGFLNTQSPVIGAALGEAFKAQGDAAGPALKKLNAALVDEAWLIPLYEQYGYAGYNSKKLAEPKFPGLQNYPTLSSIIPAA
jgi:peptide/nickel transport system substrate-binding protein